MTVFDEQTQLSWELRNIQELGQLAAELHDLGSRERAESIRDRLVSAVRPVRVSVAAGQLGVDDKTVRHWVRVGLLTAASERPLRLDARRLIEVQRLVADMRAAGARSPGLLDEVWRRLTDGELAANSSLARSLHQLRRRQRTEYQAPPGLTTPVSEDEYAMAVAELDHEDGDSAPRSKTPRPAVR